MIKPMIHLNGTGKESLARRYGDAVKILREALQAVEYTAPNGRDYYPMGPDAGARAVREHTDRMKRVRSVLEELTELRDYCNGAQPTAVAP